jgi:hypothetical protein
MCVPTDTTNCHDLNGLAYSSTAATGAAGVTFGHEYCWRTTGFPTPTALNTFPLISNFVTCVGDTVLQLALTPA